MNYLILYQTPFNVYSCTSYSYSYLIGARDLLFYRTLLTPPFFTYSISMAIYCQYTVSVRLDLK